MPKTGLSRPYVALLNDASGSPKYTGLTRAERAVKYSIKTEASESKNNSFYSDNVISESDVGTAVVTGGTVTLEVDGLGYDTSKLILGIDEKSITIATKEIKYQEFNDSMVTPFLGYGIIERHQKDGKISYVAVILPKVKFSIPDDAADTAGESVSWQTDSIDGKFYRCGSNNAFKIKSPAFDTEDAADKFIHAILGAAS